jgi:valyl-tRNA synthetase
MVAWVRDEILKMLHPFMPFITEELWRVTEGTGSRLKLLTLSNWPELTSLEGMLDPADEGIDIAIEAVTQVRSIRIESSIALKNITGIELKNFDPKNTLTLRSLLSSIARLVGADVRLIDQDGQTFEARAPSKQDADDLVEPREEVPWSPNEAQVAPPPWNDVTVRTPIREGMLSMSVRAFDIDKELGRLQKAIATADADIKRVDAKLNNEKFMANAPEEIVEEQRERREEAEARRAKILEALERLKSAA